MNGLIHTDTTVVRAWESYPLCSLAYCKASIQIGRPSAGGIGCTKNTSSMIDISSVQDINLEEPHAVFYQSHAKSHQDVSGLHAGQS